MSIDDKAIERSTFSFPAVTRVEIITQEGRKVVMRCLQGVDLDLQDSNRTIKLFMTEDKGEKEI